MVSDYVLTTVEVTGSIPVNLNAAAWQQIVVGNSVYLEKSPLLWCTDKRFLEPHSYNDGAVRLATK